MSKEITNWKTEIIEVLGEPGLPANGTEVIKALKRCGCRPPASVKALLTEIRSDPALCFRIRDRAYGNSHTLELTC